MDENDENFGRLSRIHLFSHLVGIAAKPSDHCPGSKTQLCAFHHDDNTFTLIEKARWYVAHVAHHAESLNGKRDALRALKIPDEPDRSELQEIS